jgi:glutamate synthase (NADPH/NADH) small chain
MPEWQDSVYKGDRETALKYLEQTNNLPQFTGRVCPAPCDSSCVLSLNDEPVTIRQNELSIIEKGFCDGYVKPQAPEKRTGKKVAVIGGGPAGLACADLLNQAGHTVTVYEAEDQIGGYLRFGIPDFKLDKSIIDRRLRILEQEGVVFRTGVNVEKTPK